MPGTFGVGIKSVQRGVKATASSPLTQTITAVDTTKSFVLASAKGGGTNYVSVPRVTLTDSTTITFTGADAYGGNTDWQVVEFY